MIYQLMLLCSSLPHVGITTLSDIPRDSDRRRQKSNFHSRCIRSNKYDYSEPGINLRIGGTNTAQCTQDPHGRIREMFTKVEFSVSSYDTAWVAMVPSPNSPGDPCFPECLNWLLKNQLPDGSWGLPICHPNLIKDSLLSTLASVLALRRWEDGEEHIQKGLEFIGSNFGAVMDKKQRSPIGFDIIFSGMVKYAKDFGLNLSLDPISVDAMLRKRDSEFRRLSRSNSKGKKAYLAFVAEGLLELQDWKEVMKYQRKNGSLFNSPSTTAAALIHLPNANCFKYLHSLLERFGNAVPSVYPADKYTGLCMVDRLERLGIQRHFRDEIKCVLDKTYRCWLEMDEDIVLNTETCALAFRLLRMNGYEISSDALAEFSQKEFPLESVGENHQCINTILELYKASQIIIYPKEPVLEKLHSWTSKFLQQLSSGTMHNENLRKEVDYALRFTYDSNVERMQNRRNIECYDIDNFRILKTVYRCSNIDDRDVLQLAVDDYNFCQAIHQKELKHLEGWIKENRLDQLEFARQKLTYTYFSIACNIFAPELSDARMTWTKNAFLATIIDDFYDVGGCRTELQSLITLVEKWDENSVTDYCSEQVDIIFSALHKEINEQGATAFARQGRCVKNHLVDLWLNLLKAMMRESEWVRKKSLPTMDEYMSNACVSTALGPVVLTTLYFLGPELSEGIVQSAEFNNLFKHMTICGRLSNDVQTFKREAKEGKLNSVLLHMIHGGGTVTEQEAVREMKSATDFNQRKLLKLVLQTKGSAVPKECKHLFWEANRISNLFYSRNDGFSSAEEMIGAVNAVIHDPLSLPSSIL